VRLYNRVRSQSVSYGKSRFRRHHAQKFRSPERRAVIVRPDCPARLVFGATPNLVLVALLSNLLLILLLLMLSHVPPCDFFCRPALPIRFTLRIFAVFGGVLTLFAFTPRFLHISLHISQILQVILRFDSPALGFQDGVRRLRAYRMKRSDGPRTPCTCKKVQRFISICKVL
jgi:hypothetical protein